MGFQLLTTQNAKTVRGEPLGYLTAILFLSPYTESGEANLCPHASPGCIRSCLYTAGMGRFEYVRSARRRRTLFYLYQPAQFYAQLRREIAQAYERARSRGLRLAVRLNGTSDLGGLSQRMAEEFEHLEDLTFYEYTKTPRPWERTRENLYLIFSRDEDNEADCLEALAHGINVAVVFSRRKDEPLPLEWKGLPVIDGDEHDLRFLDEPGRIVGLRAKGAAKSDDTGFVVRLPPPAPGEVLPPPRFENPYHKLRYRKPGPKKKCQARPAGLQPKLITPEHGLVKRRSVRRPQAHARAPSLPDEEHETR